MAAPFDAAVERFFVALADGRLEELAPALEAMAAEARPAAAGGGGATTACPGCGRQFGSASMRVHVSRCRAAQALAAAPPPAPERTEEQTDPRQELLQSCRAKARDAVLDALRAACRGSAPDDAEQERLCVLALGLGCARSAGNIVGGAQRQSFRRGAESVLRSLDGARTGDVFQPREAGQDEEPQPQPHMTALVALLSDATQRMGVLGADKVGFDAARAMVRALQEECQTAALKVLAALREDARLAVWEARAAAPGALEQAAGDDAIGLDMVLAQVAFALQLGRRYLGVVRQLLSDEGASGEFERQLQQLANSYLRLEELYQAQSVRKAVALAEPCELEAGGVFGSTVVEDVFFLLQKSLARAASTMDPMCALALVNYGAAALEGPLARALTESRLAAPEAAGDDGMLLDALAQALDADVVPLPRVDPALVVAANCLDVAAGYTDRLAAEAGALLAGAGPAREPAVQELERLAGDFRAALAARAGAGCAPQARVLRMWVRQALAAGFGPDAVDEAAFEQRQARDADLAGVVAQLRDAPAWRALALTPGARTAFCAHLAAAAAAEMVEGLGRVGELGALLFEREARELMSFFADLHAPFARLAAVSTLLNLDRPSDVEEFDISFAPLAAEEAVAVMRLRFDGEQVERVRRRLGVSRGGGVG